MNDGDISHSHEEGNASEEKQPPQQQRVGVEARTDRLEQPLHLQQPQLDTSLVVCSSSPDDGGPADRAANCDSIPYGNNKDGGLSASTSSSTDPSDLTRAILSPGSTTNWRTTSDKGSSTTTASSGVTKTDVDESQHPAPYKEWRLPGAAPLSAVASFCAPAPEQHQMTKALSPATSYQMHYGHQQKAQDACGNGADGSLNPSLERGWEAGITKEYPTLVGTGVDPTSSSPHLKENFMPMQSSPAGIFRLPSTVASLTSYRPSAHTAGSGRGFLRSSKSSTRKRIRRDSSSSSSFSEHEGCTVTTPFAYFPGYSPTLHTPPASPSVHPSSGEASLIATETDTPRLHPEPQGQIRHEDDPTRAHLHAAVLQRLCTTPRRRKLSSSSSSAASDEQQTVASLSSPGMLYVPLQTPRNGTPQQQHLQMQQELTQGPRTECSGGSPEQLREQQSHQAPPAHTQASPRLSCAERQLSVSRLLGQQIHIDEQHQMNPQPRDPEHQKQVRQQAQDPIRQQSREQLQLQVEQEVEQRLKQQMHPQMQRQIHQQMQQVGEEMQHKHVRQQMQHKGLQQQMQQQTHQQVVQQHPLQASPDVVDDEGVRIENQGAGSLLQGSAKAEARDSQHCETPPRDLQLLLHDRGARETTANGAGHSANAGPQSVSPRYTEGVVERLDRSAYHPLHALGALPGEILNPLKGDGTRVSPCPAVAGLASSFPAGSHAEAAPVIIRFPDSSQAGGREVQAQHSPLRGPFTSSTMVESRYSIQPPRQPQPQEQLNPSTTFAELSRMLRGHIVAGTPSTVMEAEAGEGQRALGIVQESSGLSTDACIQSSKQPSAAATSCVSRQSVLNSLGFSSGVHFSAVDPALNRRSDAAIGALTPAGGCSALLPSCAPPGRAAADIQPSDAPTHLPCCNSTTLTSEPEEAHEKLGSSHGPAAGASSSHPANKQHETRRAIVERDSESPSAGPLELPHEMLNETQLQLGLQGGSILSAVANRHAAPILTPPGVAPSPQPSSALTVQTPAYPNATATASAGELRIPLEVRGGRQDEYVSPGPQPATNTVMLGDLTSRAETSSVAPAFHKGEAPASPNRQQVTVDANTGPRNTPGLPVGVAHEGLVADATPQVDSSTATERNARPEKFTSSDVQNHAAQQLRLRQVVQVLQEHCVRLRVLEEQTSERLLQMSNGSDSHALQTRLQRFQKQQRLLRQLQQRIESRSLTLWRQERGGIRELPQLEQQPKEDGQRDWRQHEQEQQTAEPSAVFFKGDDNQGRKRSERGGPSQGRVPGIVTEDSYCGLERHADGTVRKARSREVSLEVKTRETHSWLRDPSAEAKRAADERPRYEGYPVGPTPAATTEAPTGRPAEATCRSSRDTDVPEADAEDQAGAIREKRHQENVAALIRLRQKFLSRHQEQQQSIPLPEKSSTEMYWASLLQPTEMLLDRTVALSTSLIQPGVYVYLNKCFWESNQKDWTSNHIYPYSCSSSSCSSSVPCHISRPAFDLLPVYYSSHCTPVQTVAALSPPAAAAVAVAPSDADNVLNFCFRVSLLRRRNKRHFPQQRRGIRTPQGDRSSGTSSSNSTTCSSNSSTNSGTDTSGSGTEAGSRRGSRDDGAASATGGQKTGRLPPSPLAKDGQDSRVLWPDGCPAAGEHSVAYNSNLSGESAIQSLLPFPSNIFPLPESTPKDDAVLHSATARTTVGVGGTAGGFDDADACSVPAHDPVVGDKLEIPSRSSSIFPVFPPLKLKGSYPAWVLEATQAAAIAAKAALSTTDAPDGHEAEEGREAEVFFSKEEEQQRGTYAVSVPVSLYGFNLSRRLAAAARDAAFNRIAAAAAVVAAASGTTRAGPAAETSGPAGREKQEREFFSVGPLTEVSSNIGADKNYTNRSTAPRGAMPDNNWTPTGKSTVKQHCAHAANPEQSAVERRRSSVSSTSSSHFRYSGEYVVGSWRSERRRSSADSRCEFDREWTDVARDMLLRRDPPLRKAWVSGISWRRGSSDQRNTYWSRSGHTSGGGSSGYGSNSPSPFSVAWRPSTQRSTWWGGGGTDGMSGRESSFYALRDQQQGCVASVDVPRQAEGIFVLRERATALPLAVRATVFCPNEDNTTDDIVTVDGTSAFAETVVAGGSSTFGTSSTRRRTCSPTRFGSPHLQARRGVTGAGSVTTGVNNLQQGGQLLSKLFVIDAHATSAKEPMPVKLRRVKQMAKAWFRHKKLLALLLYWQRSQQHQQHGGVTATPTTQGQPPHQPARDGKLEWKKSPSTDGNSASVAGLLQDGGDEGMEREIAETRNAIEVEALGRLLKGEMEEAGYISQLHFLGHALVSRFSSLVATASLTWTQPLQTGAASFSGQRGRHESGSARPADSSEVKAEICTVNGTHGSVVGTDTDLSSNVKEGLDCTTEGDAPSSRAGHDTITSADISRGIRALKHVTSLAFAESDGEHQPREIIDAEPAADFRHSCWSLRIGLRWRESYFAFEYYVAAIHTRTQPQTQPQQRLGKGLPEDINLRSEQHQETIQVEQHHHRQQAPGRRRVEHGRDDDQASKDKPVTDHRGSMVSVDESRDKTQGRSKMAKKNRSSASAVLLLDEMLQPCLCDVTAVQHAFQAVVMRLLPFVCINSRALRLLLGESSELRTLSRSILQRWDGAPPREPKHEGQRRIAQQEQQVQEKSESGQAQEMQQLEFKKQPVQAVQRIQQEHQDQRRLVHKEEQPQQEPKENAEQQEQPEGRKHQQEQKEEEKHVKVEDEQQVERQRQKERQAEQHLEQQMQAREPQMQEFQKGEDTSRESDTMQGLNDRVIDEILASIETEERLQRSSAFAIAAAFHESSISSTITDLPSYTVEPNRQPTAGEPACLPLFLFDCLLQSNYSCAVDATPLPDPCSVESVCSAAASLAFAISASDDTPMGGDIQQRDTLDATIREAAVSLVLAARRWGASVVDRSRSSSDSIPGKRTDILVEKSWLPFRVGAQKRERSTARRLRQLLLGSVVNGGGVTNSGKAATSASPPSRASATAGSSARLFTEDHMEIPGIDKGVITVEERPRADATSKLEKQIKWLSVKCSYIGVTDTPATSRKAALLLALLFPSQRQLLLEHLELRDSVPYDEFTRVADKSNSPFTEVLGRVPQHPRQDIRAPVVEQRHDKEQPHSRCGEAHRPFRAKQQVQNEKALQAEVLEDEKESRRHKQCAHYGVGLSETSRNHGDDFSLVDKNIQDDGLGEEDLLEKIRVAAKMMLEAALEDLWPGQDDEENAWQRVFEKSSGKREVFEEMRMLDTEIPPFTDEAPATPAESAVSSEHTEQQPDAGDFLAGNITAGSVIVEQSVQMLRQEQQQQQQQTKGQLRECEQRQYNAEQQPRVYAEQGGERLALQEVSGARSFENKIVTSADKQEMPTTWGSLSHIPRGVISEFTAAEDDLNVSLVSSVESSDAAVSNTKMRSDVPEDSEETRGEIDEEGRHEHTKENRDLRDFALASGDQTIQQDGSEECRFTGDKGQHQRVKIEGEHDEKAAGETNRLEELLLLPVEYATLGNSTERDAGGELVPADTAAADASRGTTTPLSKERAQRHQKPRGPAQLRMHHIHGTTGMHPKIRGDDPVDDNGEKRGGPASCTVAEPGISNFYPSEGDFFFCSYASSASHACREGHYASAFHKSGEVCFAPLWRSPRRSSADQLIASAIPWYAAAAMRLAAVGLMRPLACAGRFHVLRDGGKWPRGRGGADALLLLRWYNSRLTGSSSLKTTHTSVMPSNRDNLNDESSMAVAPSGGIKSWSTVDHENTAASRIPNDYTCLVPAAGGPAADATLEKLLLTCSNRRRLQQPPLWAGGVDVSRLREDLDYRIDWREDCDIGDGRLDFDPAEEDSSSSTSVDSSSSSEEEEVLSEERAAKENVGRVASAGMPGVGTTTESDFGGRTPGRRIAPEAAYREESASGVDEHGFRQQQRKKFLRERLQSSSASSGGLSEGSRELLQAEANVKREKVLDYIEERIVDQQLRDFLQGLLAIVRNARAATLATRPMTQPPKTTTGTASGTSTPRARDDWGFGIASGKFSSISASLGRGSRQLPPGAVYKEDLFSSSAFEVGAGVPFRSDAVRKQLTWNVLESIPPTWLFSLAAAEITQGQLLAAESGLLPRRSPSSDVWSYVLLPAAVAAAVPLADSASAVPAVIGGRGPLRQQQEEARRQQEEFRSRAASAVAAAAALLRQQQEDLRAPPGSNVKMPWTSLYLATATDAAAATVRQAAQAPGSRHRAELSLPSSTCSTPRPAHVSVVHGVAGAASGRRGGGWKSVPVSLSPAAADAAMSAAPTMDAVGSPREAFGRGRGSTTASFSAGAVEGHDACRNNTSASAGGAANSWTQATAAPLSSSVTCGAAGADGGRAADSAAANPYPLASALLAALQQQPPPTHCLPHHLFSQQQRPPQQHNSPLPLTSSFQQQQLHRRVSWDVEMRQQPSDSPSRSRRGSSSVQGREARSYRFGAHNSGVSHGFAGLADEDALHQLEYADANRSSLSGRKILQPAEGESMDRAARADEGGSSAPRREETLPGGRVQQQWGVDLQSLSQKDGQEVGSPRDEQDQGFGDARMEYLLHRLAGALLPSLTESGTPTNRGESPRIEIEPSEVDSVDRNIAVADPKPATGLQPEVRASTYAPLLDTGDALQGAWEDINNMVASQQESGSTVDPSYTQAQQQAVQEVLKGLITDLQGTEDADQVKAREQYAVTMQRHLKAVLEQRRIVSSTDAAPSTTADTPAATARNTGHILYGAASPQSCRTPPAGGPASSINKELLYSLLYGQTGRGVGSLFAAQQQHLQAAAAGKELTKRGDVGSSFEDAHTPEAVKLPGAVSLQTGRWSLKTGDVSPSSRLPPAVTEFTGGREEQGYEAPDGEGSALPGSVLAAGVAAPGTARHFTDVDTSITSLRKRRSQHLFTATSAEASPSSVGAFRVRERGHESSQSPGRGSAGSASGEEKFLAAPTGSGRSRRSRRVSSSSRRGSSAQDLEMAAAAAAATAELSAPEEAGAATPKRGRQRGAWGGSHSPSPSPRHHASEAGGQHKDGGLASVSHQKQHAGVAGVGEDEMVPLGALPTGVYFDVARRLWRCQWREEGRLKSKGFSLGHYASLEEAREACILYKCAVSNLPLDPTWLVPEYLPASMASKRLVKHRQPSSLPINSSENSPVPAGMEEPHSPLAAESATTSGFTPSSSGRSLADICFRYGTPTTPRATSSGSSTDDVGQFSPVPSYSAATPKMLGTADYCGGDPSSSSGGSALLSCILSPSSGNKTLSAAEGCYTQDSNRSGVVASTPPRSSCESNPSPSYLSAEPTTQSQREQHQLYSGDLLSPVTPSSDAEAPTGEICTANRKRRRFVAEAVAAEVRMNTDALQAPKAQNPSTDGVQLAAAITSDDVRAAGTSKEGSESSASSAYHLPSTTETPQGSQARMQLADVLPAQDRFYTEVSKNRDNGTNWNFAPDTQETTGVADALSLQELSAFWTGESAGTDAATDAAQVVGRVEETVDLKAGPVPLKQPRVQATVTTPAASTRVTPTGNQKGGQNSSEECKEGEHQEHVLAAGASKLISQLQE